MIVGTHFYQTHPDFLEEFIGNESVRVASSSGGVFHPKLYFFTMRDGWKCIIGSANFTSAAFSRNDECAALLDDENDEFEFGEMKNDYFDEVFSKGMKLTKQGINKYRSAWRKAYLRRRDLQGGYGDKKRTRENPICELSWEEYLLEVKNDPNLDFKIRMNVLNDARSIFKKNKFVKLDSETRQNIAGVSRVGNEGKEKWDYFGRMMRATNFQKEIGKNNIAISEALDAIPSSGKVSKKQYSIFASKFKELFSSESLGTGTRLLAMKRPDYFLCLSGANKDGFCADFGIPPNRINLNNYWDEVVERVMDCAWWNSERPKNKEERKIWEGRAALLDVFYYNPKKK